jgi:Ser/Thr protein kinase RdoA (MazF antagonist)
MRNDILAAFGFKTSTPLEAVGEGLTNETFKTRTNEGEFIIQSLHPAVKSEAIEDMIVVTEYLSKHGIVVPILRKTLAGSAFFLDSRGIRWRMYPYIAGRTLDVMPSLKGAHSCGEYFGTLHRLLRNLTYMPIGTPEHFHDVPFTISKLRYDFDRLPENIKPIAREILEMIPRYYLVSKERQVIHSDPKISNILFALDGDHVKGLLDFDYIAFNTRFVDIGDALRSWCNATLEDDPNPAFNMQYFEAIMRGYESGWNEPVARDESLEAAKCITLELASRFLHDAVEPHFAWNAKKYRSREECAYARGLSQLRLAKSIPV